jgi:methylated-DNA-[protein]-cysteine S-methyltransferase
MTSPFAFSPTLTPPVLPESDVSYAAHDTPVGRLLLASAGGRLVLCAYAADAAAEDRLLARVAGAVSPRVLRHPRPLDAARRQVDEFLDGRRHAFDLETELALASPFQREVLTGLDGTAYGMTTTYGALAHAIGHDGAARAVGTALGANPLCIVLPCHRVLPAGGSAAGRVGGYAGGSAAKEALLALEASA